MQVIYLRKDEGTFQRKISLDMPYLSSHKKIRMLKSYYEVGLFLLHRDKNSAKDIDKYFLTEDKIIKEDKDFFYFKFPFTPAQVEDIR